MAAVEQFLSQSDAGYFVVALEIRPGNIINVEIEHDTQNLDIDFCVALSRHLHDLFGEELDDYEVTIGSAGITTPLRLPRQYRKHIGHDLEVLLKAGIKERGRLLSADSESFEIEVIRMEKPEGARRKIAVPYTLTYKYEEVKRVVYDLKV